MRSIVLTPEFGDVAVLAEDCKPIRELLDCETEAVSGSLAPLVVGVAYAGAYLLGALAGTGLVIGGFVLVQAVTD
jgi:hypothetical protein